MLKMPRNTETPIESICIVSDPTKPINITELDSDTKNGACNYISVGWHNNTQGESQEYKYINSLI